MAVCRYQDMHGGFFSHYLLFTEIYYISELKCILSCSAGLSSQWSPVETPPSAPSAAFISSVYLRLLLVFPELHCAGHIRSLWPSCAHSRSPFAAAAEPLHVCVCVFVCEDSFILC